MVTVEAMQGMPGLAPLLFYGCEPWRACGNGVRAPSRHKPRGSRSKNTG